MNRIIIRFVSILLPMAIFPLMAVAQKCTITDMNTETVKVNGRELKKGDTFTLTDCKAIDWVSDKQYVIVRDKDGLTRQLTKLNVCDSDEPWSLKRFLISVTEYLTRTRVLATKSLNPTVQNNYDPTMQQYYDERVQLVDTLAFPLESPYGKDQLYIAACTDGKFRERTILPPSPDGKNLYLTRAIYGHHQPPTKATYVCILCYDYNRPEAAPDVLGYLLVEALPLELK